jgi:DNA-binding MarR family transcriptional regulator
MAPPGAECNNIGEIEKRVGILQMKTPKEEGSLAEAFHLDDFLPHRLVVASDAVSRLITRKHLAKAGLALPEWRLLAAVGRSGLLSPTAAGERTAMDKVKVSRAATSLVARGMMRQTKDPNDGRGRLLRLTRKGATLHSELTATAGVIEQALMAGVTKTEWSTLHRTLGKLSSHARSILDNGEDHEED